MIAITEEDATMESVDVIKDTVERLARTLTPSVGSGKRLVSLLLNINGKKMFHLVFQGIKIKHKELNCSES